MSRHKLTFILTKTVDLSDPDDPEGSIEVEELVEELEDGGWAVEIKSVLPERGEREEGDEEEEEEDEEEEDEEGEDD